MTGISSRALARNLLGSASLASTQTTASGSLVNVPGLSRQVTPSGRVLVVRVVFAGLCTASGGGTTTGTASYALMAGATQLDYREAVYNNGKWQSLSMEVIHTPAAGTPVTYALQFAHYNGTGSDLAQVVCAATGPIGTLTIVEV